MKPETWGLVGVGSGAFGLRPAQFLGVMLTVQLVNFLRRPPAASTTNDVFVRSALNLGASVGGYLVGQVAYRRCKALPGT